MINCLQETNQPVGVQETTFSVDVMGRFICNTWDEAVNNGGVAFDAVVIGTGMFGAYCAEKIYRHANLRVLVLDAGSFLSPSMFRISRKSASTLAPQFKLPPTPRIPARENWYGARHGAVKSPFPA
jgi:hypothetical protein